MDAVNDQQAWDEAMGRVMAYLAALELGGVERRTRVAMSILDRARERCVRAAELPAAEAAMTETAETLRVWFAGIFPNDPETAFERGVVAMKATDAARRWPDAVLTDHPPLAMREALVAAAFPTAPDITLSSMAARDMDFGAMESIAQETWQQFKWAPVLQAAALWTAIFFIALYAYDRFVK